MDNTLNIVGAFLLALLAILLIYSSIKFVLKATKNPNPGEQANGVGAIAIALVPAALGGALFIGIVGALVGWINLPGMS